MISSLKSSRLLDLTSGAVGRRLRAGSEPKSSARANLVQLQKLGGALMRRAAEQRVPSVYRDHRAHGVGRITIIEVLGQMPRGRPVLVVLLTFTR